MAFDYAAAYRGARDRVTAFVREAGGNAVADVPVPATPKWTVHDVLAHLRFVVVDGLSGNMKGAPGEEWTAAQVARGAGSSVELLLEDWADDAPAVEAALAGAQGGMLSALIMDVHAHEQDLRGALGVPGMRSGEFYDWSVPQLMGAFRAKAAGAGLASVRVSWGTGSAGDDDDPVVLEAAEWELFRGAMGRRSAAQVAAWPWSGTSQPQAYVEPFMIFGPAVADVIE